MNKKLKIDWRKIWVPYLSWRDKFTREQADIYWKAEREKIKELIEKQLVNKK